MGASRFRLNIRGAGCMWGLNGWPPYQAAQNIKCLFQERIRNGCLISA